MKTQIVQCPSCKAGLKIKLTDPDSPISCPNCNYRNHPSMFVSIPLKRVQCRRCNSILSVREDAKGEIICPKCKNKDDISNFPPPTISTKPQPSGEEQTRISPDIFNRKKVATPGILKLEKGNCNSLVVTLNRGINVIGKKSISSSSSIQLDSPDEYMSRRHIIIDVVMNSNSSLEHLLSDAGSKNGTFHNEERIGAGDIIILSSGDTIKMGKCTFRFMLE